MESKSTSKMCDSWNVVSYKNFDIESVNINELVTEDKLGNPKKMNTFTLSYDGKPFLFQTPLITIEYGGIPKSDSDYVNSDDDRKKISVPLDINEDIQITKETKEQNDKRKSEMSIFKSKMNDISELLTNEETIKQLFKAKDPSKYNMKWPLIQETERGDKINLKFKYEYPNVTFKKLDGSTESINHTTFTEVDEFEKFVPYLSQAKFIFRVSGYAQKKAVGKQPLEYGITLNLEYVLSNEKVKRVVVSDGARFIDSDDEADETPVDESVEASPVDESVEASADDNEEDSPDEEDEEEELPEIKPKRRSRKKKD